jgi:hypothetical protein
MSAFFLGSMDTILDATQLAPITCEFLTELQGSQSSRQVPSKFPTATAVDALTRFRGCAAMQILALLTKDEANSFQRPGLLFLLFKNPGVGQTRTLDSPQIVENIDSKTRSVHPVQLSKPTVTTELKGLDRGAVLVHLRKADLILRACRPSCCMVSPPSGIVGCTRLNLWLTRATMSLFLTCEGERHAELRNLITDTSFNQLLAVRSYCILRHTCPH